MPPAAIGVVRVSGPGAREALHALAGRVPKVRRASLADLKDADGAPALVRAALFRRSAAVLRNGQLYMFDTLEEAKRLYDYEAHS